MACGSSWSQESALMESSLGRGEMGSSLQYEDWFSSLQQTRWNLVFSTFWASPLNPPGQSPTDSKQKLEVEGLSILPLLSVWFCGGYESYENLFLCKKYHFVFFLIILNLSWCPQPSSWRNLIPIIAWLSPPLSLTGPEEAEIFRALPGLVFLGYHRAVLRRLPSQRLEIAQGSRDLSPWLHKVLISLS